MTGDADRDDGYVCSCGKRGVCVVCRVWLDNKIDDMIHAWHDGGGLGVTLRDYLGMTVGQYGRWLRDAEDIDAEVRERLCWGS